MTSWGRVPTDEVHEVPVARRLSRRDPVKLRWCPLLDSSGTQRPDTAQTRFEHRDHRLWTFQITAMPENNPLKIAGHSFYIYGTGAGCEPVRFISSNITNSKRTVERFANMPLDNYQILIADAAGTSDHPVGGTVATIIIRRERRTRRSALPNDYDIEYEDEERIGMVDGTCVRLFPTQHEINDVLDTVLANHSDIVERVIEEHGMDDVRTRRQRPAAVAPMQQAGASQHFTSRRQFGAAAVAMDSMCAPAAREARAIQL